jgi:hypothetical protein
LEEAVVGRRNVRLRPQWREEIDIKRLAMAMAELAAHIQREEQVGEQQAVPADEPSREVRP